MRVLQSLMELIEIRNVLSPQVIVSMPEEFALKKKNKKKKTVKQRQEVPIPV